MRIILRNVYFLKFKNKIPYQSKIIVRYQMLIKKILCHKNAMIVILK